MNTRQMGRTKIAVPELGMGTWGMGGRWGPRDDRAAVSAIEAALAGGIAFLDTAVAYGNGHSEMLVGNVLRKKRLRAFVATKIPPKNHTWPGCGSAREAFPADWIVEQTEASLRHLQCETLDLQQLHVWSPTWLDERETWLSAVEQLKQSGKIRFFGVSLNDHDPNSGVALVESGLVDTVQVIYNVFDQSPEARLFPACVAHGVGVIARVPFDEGGLCGDLTPDATFHSKDWRRHYFSGDRLAETCRRAAAVWETGAPHAASLSELALRFCLSHPAVSVVIPGMRRAEHVAANIAAANQGPLSSECLRALKMHAWPRNFY